MMKKPVREWLLAHPTLLPPDIRHWLPEDHLMWFVNVPIVADTGYFSAANIDAAIEQGFDPYIAPERTRHRRYQLPELDPDGEAEDAASEQSGRSDSGESDSSNAGEPAHPSPRDAMRAKLRTPKGATLYAKRKTTPEPVFGQILEIRGFRRFMLRGLEKVNGEWDLVTLAHNLLKLWRSGEELPAVG